MISIENYYVSHNNKTYSISDHSGLSCEILVDRSVENDDKITVKSYEIILLCNEAITEITNVKIESKIGDKNSRNLPTQYKPCNCASLIFVSCVLDIFNIESLVFSYYFICDFSFIILFTEATTKVFNNF